MSSWVCSYVTRNVATSDHPPQHPFSLSQHFGSPASFRRASVKLPLTSTPKFRPLKLQKFQSLSSTHEGEEDSESVVQTLKIPDEWLLPSKAIEESEWLRVTLHKWLDDEYCPEPTNVEISNVAAKSLYTSLLEKETDMGTILLKMAQDLTSISYQESFHGAFTSANAAINLIVERLES
ncbi:hypothetical protein IGI04_033067 [Brassica rapa subsp. trilocularis]|uniref:Uncharacterized protein n=1 Tax=Brassica rapa subsp. trilocularis TaxID=1813537 RepID=A0ABQ7L5V0_BRACM|nr:hypothetical protein IGI04_033067 [Brassica rapa subsp. trilocularis]